MQEAQIAESQIGIQNWAFCGVNKIRLLFTSFDGTEAVYAILDSSIKKKFQKTPNKDADHREQHRYKITTDSRHKMPVSTNVQDRKFEVSKSKEAWVGDCHRRRKSA